VRAKHAGHDGFSHRETIGRHSSAERRRLSLGTDAQSCSPTIWANAA
jgi:hypothetical protein